MAAAAQRTSLASRERDQQNNVLNLQWSFGVNRNANSQVHNITDNYRKAVFYTSSNTGIVYDFQSGKQHLLQGHCNAIATTAVSNDKRWLLTADHGENSMITVWDTFPHLDITIHQPQTAANSKAAKDYPAGHNAPITAMPIKTIFSPHGGMGTVSAIFTRDCKYILSIGSDSPQTLCIWDWTTESDSPIIQTELKGSAQDSIRINPEDPTEFLTTGVKSVNFFLWDKETGIKQFTPNFEPRYDEYSCGRADSIRVSPLDFKHEHTGFTCTTFIPSSSQAVSGTKEGAVVIWSDRTLNNLSVKLEKGLKAAVKVLKLHNAAITHIESVANKHIVTGGADGFVKVYDNTFRLLLWFEKLKAGPISYLSFNQPVEVPTLSDSQEDVKEASSSRNNAPNGSSRPSSGASSTTSSSESIVSDIDIPEFVVSTSDGKVLLLEKSNATGNASGAAAVVAARLAIRADSRQKKKSALDWVDQSTVKGSNGDIHDASVSRPTSQAGGLSGSEIMKRPSSKPSSAGSTKSSETPSIKLILETLSSTISNLVTHPQKHCYAVSCQNGVLQLWDYKKKIMIASRKFEILKEVDATNEAKKKVNRRSDKAEEWISAKITALSFSTSGSILAVGFENGSVRIVNPEDLSDYHELLSTSNSPPQAPFPYNSTNMALSNKNSRHVSIIVSKDAIVRLAFSHDEEYLATADAGFGVTVIRREPIAGQIPIKTMGMMTAAPAAGPLAKVGSPKKGSPPNKTSSTPPAVPVPQPASNSDSSKTKAKVQWVFCGRNQAHYKDITALLFIPPTAESDKAFPDPRLISVSLDRHVAEYDAKNASIQGGLILRNLHRIEQTARPLAAIFYPKSDSDVSDLFLLTTNTEFKLKTYNARTRFCRRTTLGPSYGDCLNKLQVIPLRSDDQYIAFASQNQVAGIMKLPLDGNPYRAMGMIAHPGKISSIACSHDGEFLFTAGGEDGSIHMWAINPSVVDAQVALAGNEIDCFLNVADETKMGTNGVFYKEMEDYFYYAQLRSQGENATATRKISETVALEQVPFIMQALGYYPSQYEIENMLNELKYSNVETSSGLVESITFAELLKLYVNHKPVHSYSSEEIETALSCALELDPNRKNVRFEKGTKKEEGDKCTKEGFLSLIQLYGETMTTEEVANNFEDLCKEEIPSHFTSTQLIEDMLGFQHIQNQV